MTTFVVSDLDGTLAFDGRPPVRAITDLLHALSTAPGVRLVLATSRSPRSLRKWFGELADRIDLICCNGALVVGPHGELDRRPLPPAALGTMLAELRSAGEDFCLEHGDHFTASSADALPWMGSDRRITLCPGEQIPMDGVLKLSIAHADPWAPRLHMLAPHDVEVFPHLTGDADVVAAGVTKALALDRLLAGADRSTVTAFGNDANDLDMLREADRAIVVGSGLPGLDRLGHVRRIPADDTIIAEVLAAELDLAGYQVELVTESARS